MQGVTLYVWELNRNQHSRIVHSYYRRDGGSDDCSRDGGGGGSGG